VVVTTRGFAQGVRKLSGPMVAEGGWDNHVTVCVRGSEGRITKVEFSSREVEQIVAAISPYDEDARDKFFSTLRKG
jgi:hypothetical protein